MSLEQEQLIDSNIRAMKALKASMNNNSVEVESPNVVAIMKATLEAMKIFDAHNTCLTVEECADFLQIHKNTVKRQIHDGEIDARFIGRIWRIPKLQFVDKILEMET